MTALLLGLVFANQPAPVIGPGANRWFHESVAIVEKYMSSGSWDDARRALSRLCDGSAIAISWDDSAVPQNRKVEIRQALDEAVQCWQFQLPALKLVPSKHPTIKFAFVPKLPTAPGENMPKGAVFFTSTDLKEPAVEALIGLTRGRELGPATATDVAHELAHAIGLALGAEETLRNSGVMGRVDHHYAARPAVSPWEGQVVSSNVETVQKLKAAVAAKTKLSFGTPTLQFEPASVVTRPTVQGERLEFSIQITNAGTSPLTFKLLPDCSCFSIQQSRGLDPGQTGIIRVGADTSLLAGHTRKTLYLYTNDPDNLVRLIPVQFTVEPRYRFLSELGTRTLLLSDRGTLFEVFLAVNPKTPFEIKSARLEGMAAEVVYEPWQGTMADPELGEGPMPRSGYRFRALLGAGALAGRVPVTLLIETDKPELGKLAYTLFCQKGIVALPGQVYFGQMQPVPRTAVFLVSRPGKSFRVLRVESDSPNLKAVARDEGDQCNYRVTVEYDGKAQPGNFAATIRIHTDDPQQPVIEVPATGIAR
jgi:hypothetical protein